MNCEGMPESAGITEYLYRKSAAMRVPCSGTFEVTPLCNFQCRMCYVRKSAAEAAASPRPMMALEDWMRLAREAREQGLLDLLITGGEPLLWPDFWPFYEELIRMGFVVSVNTNGSLIDEAAVRRFRELPPRKINITLYGASDETYRRLCGVNNVYARVIRGIRMLRQAGILVKLNCSVTPCNSGDLEKINDFARENGLFFSASAYMFPPVRRDSTATGVNTARFSPEETAAWRLKIYRIQHSPEQYRRLLGDILAGASTPPGLDPSCAESEGDPMRCAAGRSSFWVTWDGWMTPCGTMCEPKTDAQALPFGRAWQQLTQEVDRIRLSGLCSRCPNLQLCHPCAAMAAAETGDPSRVPRFLCRISREMYRIARQELQAP